MILDFFKKLFAPFFRHKELAEKQVLLIAQLDDSKQKLEGLSFDYQNTCKQLDEASKNLKASEQKLQEVENDRTQLQQQLNEVSLRQSLTAQLLAATNQNPGVLKYFSVLEEKYLPFANEEDALEDEAAALLELQAIGDELKVVGAYPEFYKKRAVAIAGGFSAGKSEFISSLFQNPSVRLPIGIEPTTAIPTYALNGDEKSLIGCNQNGGVIDLLKIDPEFQKRLSHNFIRSFGFNLKTILPFIFLTTPMNYQHLCFIDTPGYNPSDVLDGHTSEDVKTAEEFVRNAEALLWIVGLDSNGTISKSDLDFLEEVHYGIQKPLYVVLNKADLRPFDQLQDIMDEIVDTLSDYGIEIQGISAYSSVHKKEYLFQKQSLFDFLETLDKPSDNHALLLKRLHTVDEKYQYAILRSMKEEKQISKALRSLEADLLKEGLDDLEADFYTKIQKINTLFTSKKKQEMLKKLECVFAELEQAINEVFGQTSSVQRKKLTQKDVDLSDGYKNLTEKSGSKEGGEVEMAATNKKQKKGKTESETKREQSELNKLVNKLEGDLDDLMQAMSSAFEVFGKL